MLNYVFDKDLGPNEPMQLCAYDYCWDNETRKQLRDEYNIIFGTHQSSVLPIMIIYRKDAEPLFVIGSEDDGTITFDRKDGQFMNCFSSGWARSLISDLEEALEHIKEVNHETNRC
jgi:hypothetical protein